jgi:hypothetical protein
MTPTGFASNHGFDVFLFDWETAVKNARTRHAISTKVGQSVSFNVPKLLGQLLARICLRLKSYVAGDVSNRRWMA